MDIDNKKDLQIEYIDNIRNAYLKKEKINKSIEKNTINDKNMNLIQLNEENNNEINSSKKMNSKSIEKEENKIYKASAKLEEVNKNKVDSPIIILLYLFNPQSPFI